MCHTGEIWKKRPHAFNSTSFKGTAVGMRGLGKRMRLHFILNTRLHMYYFDKYFKNTNTNINTKKKLKEKFKVTRTKINS